MRLSEVFLRLASALVGWMMLYAYFVWLAALRNIGCGPDGDEMYKLLLGIVPFVICGGFALRLVRPLPEIHGMLRWLALPIGLLYPFALAHIWSVWRQVNRGFASLCGAQEAESWQLMWAPIQVLTLAFIGWALARLWMSKPGPEI